MTETLPGAPAGLNEPPSSSEHNHAESGLPKDELRQQRIQTRAYKLWEEAGKPVGDAERERFWFEAEALIDCDESEVS